MPVSTSAPILVATDAVADAELVKKILADEFDNVVTSTVASRAVQDFEAQRPQVLILAFDTLEKAERHYLGLYRLSTQMQAVPHRALILCGKNELQRVYELCRQQHFHDYVLFWPLTHDATRLAMTVHQALRDLAGSGGSGPTAAAFATQARRLGELEVLLKQYTAQGKQCLDIASGTVQRAQVDIGVALDVLSRGLAGAGDTTALAQQIDRLKTHDVGDSFQGINSAIQPLRQWGAALKQNLVPALQAADALQALAARTRRVVLVVDDDEFQRNLMVRMLSDANVDVVRAASGMEALAAVNRRRPDLILMDIGLPGIDGLEVTRRLKAVEHLASIPIVMITGESGKNIVVDSLKAGASDFVVKPYNRAA
jgi:PleD family two-component response regulator